MAATSAYEAGDSWLAVGTVLGISRQAAQQRYSTFAFAEGDLPSATSLSNGSLSNDEPVTSRRVLLTLHVLAVLAGLGYFAVAVAVADPEGGANIGAGLGLLWLMVLGSPWSWPLVAVDDLSGPLWAAAIIGTAVLNLVLHAWWQVRRSSRVS